MTDKEYEIQKARLKKAIDKWFDIFGLGWYTIDMAYARERDETVSTTAGKVTTHWQYRSAKITWFLPAIADCDDDYLEGIVTHEFSHILVAPLCLVDSEEDLPTQHEFATESVARALIWAYEAGMKGKK